MGKLRTFATIGCVTAGCIAGWIWNASQQGLTRDIAGWLTPPPVSQAVAQATELAQEDPAIAQRRVALVIGNASYATGIPLRNPLNDARDMAASFRELGFEEVILVADADLRAMETALSQFFTEIKRGGVGVFYYAGHGVQSNGENYLLPVDANIEIEQDIRLESLPLAKVLGRMEAAGNAANIIILDACRNDPFSRGWRSQTKGLASVDAAEGVLIAYATAPGEVAFDGEGRNGTFTEALLQNLRAPGQAVELMLKNVRRAVKDATDDRQIPWTASSLVGDFSFSPAPPAASTDPDLAPPPNNPDDLDPNLLSLAQQPALESGPEADLEAMYRQLEAYLAVGDWLSADLQNAWLIAQVADGDRNYRAVSLEEITAFSCDDFQRIDRLWQHYSNDHFGYSVQLAAIATNGDTPAAVRTDARAFRRLAIAVGWKTGTDRSGQGYRLYPGEHFFTLGAPAGHLPRRNVIQFQADGKWVGFQRADECGL